MKKWKYPQYYCSTVYATIRVVIYNGQVWEIYDWNFPKNKKDIYKTTVERAKKLCSYSFSEVLSVEWYAEYRRKKIRIRKYDFTKMKSKK